MTTATLILSEAAQLGVELQLHGDRLRYRPQNRMTPDLAERLRSHRRDVLTLLRTEDTAPILAAPKPIYSSTERQRLSEAGIDPSKMPILNAVKATFPEAVVIEARYDRYIASNPRRQPVIDLLWPIAQTNPARARDLADEWMERVAICEMDGGLSSAEAEEVALKEILDHMTSIAYTINNEHNIGSSSASGRS